MATRLSLSLILAMGLGATAYVNNVYTAGRRQKVVRMAAKTSGKAVKSKALKSKSKSAAAPSAKSLFGGAFSSKPEFPKFEVPSSKSAKPLKFEVPFGKQKEEGLKGITINGRTITLPKLPVIDGSDLDNSFNDYAKPPAIPKAITSKIPNLKVEQKIKTAKKVIPKKNPRQDVLDKARDLDIIGKATGLDFVGLLDWNSRSDFIKKGVVVALGGGSLGGLGLQVYLGVTAGEREKAAAAAVAKAAADKKAAEEAAKKREADIQAAKADAEKKKADDEKAAKKKAEDDKKKAEIDEKERLRKQDETSAADARQVIIDEANRKKAFTTEDRIAGSKARRKQLFNQYNIDDKVAKQI